MGQRLNLIKAIPVMRTFVLIALLTFVALIVAADPPGKPHEKDKTAANVRERFFRCWLETEEVREGTRFIDAGKLNVNEYTIDNKSWSWGRRGKMSAGSGSPGVRIDPTTDPMRVEFFDEGSSRNFGGDEGDKVVPVVRPCIFKFDGENLVIAYSGQWTVEKEFKKGEDYPQRPTGFKSTKENKLTVTTMKPCGKWDTD
jgi:hypothetical protein